MPSKPIWTEGLLVSQHHFQQQDRYHEGLLSDRLGALVHYDWGVTDLEIDERALTSGLLRLRRFSAIWPDGTSIRCGEGTEDPPPAPRAFEPFFAADKAELEIFLGLANESDVSANVAGVEESNAARRFIQSPRNVRDLNTGGSPQDVDWGRPNLRVFFGEERKDGFSTIRIAELVRQANGQPIVRDNYVPPVLQIGAAPFLAAGLGRVLTSVTARQRELNQARKGRHEGSVEFHSADARRFWLLHTLNSAIPRLAHLMETRRAHPEEAYLLLATLVAQLSSFAADGDPTSIPKFNYLELGDVFEPLFARVLSLISGGIEDAFIEIPLEHRPDGMFIGKLPDPGIAKNEFFIAVKANMAEALLRERVPGVLKVAAWNQIYDVVKQARHGVRVDIEWKPSGALPIKPGLCFFRMRRDGSFWDEIAKSSTLALYLPTDAEWNGASLSVFAIDPVHLR